jgi:hypothetical protein
MYEDRHRELGAYVPKLIEVFAIEFVLQHSGADLDADETEHLGALDLCCGVIALKRNAGESTQPILPVDHLHQTIVYARRPRHALGGGEQGPEEVGPDADDR